MKTAEEWFKEGRSKTRNLEDSIKFLQQIQLDAAKAGMRLAIKELGYRLETIEALGDRQIYGNTIHELKTRIEKLRTTASNLTLEQLKDL